MNELPPAALLLQLAEAAGRAPSPHNIQPARWCFARGAQGRPRVELHEATDRWLRVGDPTGRDNALALGAAWEGMALALSALGLGLAGGRVEDLHWPPPSAAHRLVASAELRADVAPDALAAEVPRRQSFRGTFRPSSPADRAALAALVASQPLRILDAATNLARVAGWYDEAAAAGMRDPLFVAELYRWMRFSPAEPDWGRDGLSTDCLALSPFEAAAARVALQPGVVRILTALGLERLLVSEAAKVRSAAAVVLLHRPADEPWFDAGRLFYRVWLDITRAGLCGVPMSALADSPTHAALLLQAAPLPPGHRLVGVMRIGGRPAEPIARSARLPAADLLLDQAS